MNTDIQMSGSTVKNHISLKNGIRIQSDTENFVSDRGSRLVRKFFLKLVYFNTCDTLKQEIDHSKSSSTSSTLTPKTSSTEIDHSDHPPAIVSSESVDKNGETWMGRITIPLSSKAH